MLNRFGYIFTVLALVFPTAVSPLGGKEVYFEAMKIHHQGKEFSVPAFLLDTMEVSNQQYKEFLRETGVKAPLSFRIPRLNRGDHPVTGMDWYDASFFCKFYGKRLPTYVELVRASQGEILRKFPFGNTSPDFEKAPFQTLEYQPLGTSPVHSFTQFRTPEGILNLAGNVREWTEEAPSDKGMETRASSRRRIYGGSFASRIQDVQVGSFQWAGLGSIQRDVGFRCARDLNADYDFSNVINLDPQVLRELVYGQKASREEMIKASTSQSLQNVRKAQSVSDREKLNSLVRRTSLETLRSRELLVSEQVEIENEVLSGIPFGISWIGGSGDSEPVLVYQNRYNIGKNLVTNEEFQNHHRERGTKPELPPGYVFDDRLAPARATWEDARNFCLVKGMDLPTEIQWEKSIRGVEREPKLRFTPNGKPRGYYEIFQVVSGASEWMRDSWNLPIEKLSSDKIPRNPVGKHSYLKAVRGRGEFPETFSGISHRRASLPFALHSFRCVQEVDEKPDFLINREWNYFFPGFFSALQTRIQNGEDVFDLNLKLDAFENEP